MDGGFYYDSDAVAPESFDRALAHVQQTLDLRAVVRSYGADLDERSDGSYKVACFLRSTTGYDGTCSDEDARENGGTPPASMKLYDSDVPGAMRWVCYSCKRHGCVVDLIAHAEGWAANEGRRTSLRALRRACQLAGLSYILDNRPPSSRDVADTELTQDAEHPIPPARRVVTTPAADVALAHDVNCFAAQHWYATLRGPDGEPGRIYLRSRNVTDEQADRYGLGYARAAWSDLAKRLPPQTKALAQRLGLLSMSARNSLIDAQRDRLMFPYMMPRDGDAATFVVTGFAGRRRNDADTRAPKFHNSNNVPGVWEKSSALWGVWQARERVRETGRVVVPEGGWDVLAFDRIGAAAVTAVGLAFTPEHARGVRQLGARRVTLADDGDAGRRAVPSWVASLLAEGYELADIDIIASDDGSDPDETDPDVLAQRYAAPLTVAEYMDRFGFAVPQPPNRERQRLETHIRELVAAIAAPPPAWETHADYLTWFNANNELRAELARVRKQLADC